ncbi:NUDIX hydrolase [Nocardia sp. NPDC051990]|uniref:NUDIX hydrolase n=1 Tax=Nocardia sp. NPDC051990 TaxID=3155285 RepID=UPI00343C0A89
MTSGYVPQMYSISIKGVVVRDGRVLLLKNEREEWELPGGRIEPGETPEECVTISTAGASTASNSSTQPSSPTRPIVPSLNSM